MKKILSIIAILAITTHSSVAQSVMLTVTVKGFKSTAGTVKFQMVDENEKEVLSLVDKLTDKTYTWKVNIKTKGKYAINVIHDKNNNNKLDTNVFGIPKEGWGCSNNARGALGAPKHKDKIVTITANKSITINLVHY
jgi:uncharacterized protein (DUF2141 family)